MSIPEIAWDKFSWEAFATLVTGSIAVVGAVWLGKRQTLILDRQTQIEALKARIDVFDRRMLIIDLHVKLMSRAFSRETRAPHVLEFMDRRGSVEFLFNEKISRLFDEAYGIGIDIDHNKGEDWRKEEVRAKENRTAFVTAVRPFMKINTPS